jgi:hypothetical protein
MKGKKKTKIKIKKAGRESARYVSERRIKNRKKKTMTLRGERKESVAALFSIPRLI